MATPLVILLAVGLAGFRVQAEAFASETEVFPAINLLAKRRKAERLRPSLYDTTLSAADGDKALLRDLGIARLQKELRERGLGTHGSLAALSGRLAEALRGNITKQSSTALRGRQGKAKGLEQGLARRSKSEDPRETTPLTQNETALRLLGWSRLHRELGERNLPDHGKAPLLAKRLLQAMEEGVEKPRRRKHRTQGSEVNFAKKDRKLKNTELMRKPKKTEMTWTKLLDTLKKTATNNAPASPEAPRLAQQLLQSLHPKLPKEQRRAMKLETAEATGETIVKMTSKSRRHPAMLTAVGWNNLAQELMAHQLPTSGKAPVIAKRLLGSLTKEQAKAAPRVAQINPAASAMLFQVDSAQVQVHKVEAGSAQFVGATAERPHWRKDAHPPRKVALPPKKGVWGRLSAALKMVVEARFLKMPEDSKAPQLARRLMEQLVAKGQVQKTELALPIQDLARVNSKNDILHSQTLFPIKAADKTVTSHSAIVPAHGPQEMHQMSQKADAAEWQPFHWGNLLKVLHSGNLPKSGEATQTAKRLLVTLEEAMMVKPKGQEKLFMGPPKKKPNFWANMKRVMKSDGRAVKSRTQAALAQGWGA